MLTSLPVSCIPHVPVLLVPWPSPEVDVVSCGCRARQMECRDAFVSRGCRA